MKASRWQRCGRPAGAFDGAPIAFALILANVAVFVGEVLASRSLASVVAVPANVYLAFGANYAPLTLALGQYDRLVASCFLHGSLLHVALNMWSFRQIGPFVERTAGHGRFALLYLLTGIAGSLTSVLWALISGRVFPSVGASGAICGVIGAALVIAIRLDGWGSPMAKQLGFWLILLGVFGATVKGIDNACHLGGVVSGCAIAVVWRRGVKYSATATFTVVAFTALVCVASGIAVVWRDATDPYALLDRNERGHRVQLLLGEHDCAGARRAFVATEAARGEETPELQWLRDQLERECPPGSTK